MNPIRFDLNYNEDPRHLSFNQSHNIQMIPNVATRIKHHVYEMLKTLKHHLARVLRNIEKFEKCAIPIGDDLSS